MNSFILLGLSLFIAILPNHANIEKREISSQKCNWSPWRQWSECRGTCGGQIRTRKRECICQDDSDYDCKGRNREREYCKSNCVRTLDYWKYHNKFAIQKQLSKPWPYPEITSFSCDLGRDSFRESVNWYDVIIAKPKSSDSWAFLVQQFVASILNVLAGADDKSVAGNITRAQELIRDCDGYSKRNLELVLKVTSILEKFNTGKLGVPICQEKPCCFFNGWEDWADCSKDCNGVRTRYERCFCPAFTGVADELWCKGTRKQETVPCNRTVCNSDKNLVPEGSSAKIGPTINIPKPELIPLTNEETEGEPCHWGEWGAWSECSLPCGGGRRWRDLDCICNSTKKSSQNCDNPPEPRKYVNCNMEECKKKDETKPPENAHNETTGRYSSPKTVEEGNVNAQQISPQIKTRKEERFPGCNWREWGDWTPCSTECKGTRWRKKLCFCDNISSAYDDTYCGEFPPMEDETCGTACTIKTHSVHFWLTHNSLATGSMRRPWPIPETTTLSCPDLSSPPTYLFFLSSDPPITSPKIPSLLFPLIREYIAALLNVYSGVHPPPQVFSTITDTSLIIRSCTREQEKSRIDSLVKILQQWNSADEKISESSESEFLLTGLDSKPSLPSWPIIVGSIIGGIFIVIAAISMTASIMKERYNQRVFEVPEPEFELEAYDSEEEMIKLESKFVGQDENHGKKEMEKERDMIFRHRHKVSVADYLLEEKEEDDNFFELKL